MSIYITIITLLLIEIVLFGQSSKEAMHYKFAFVLTVVFLALVAGTRAYSVGHDTLNYCHIFEDIGAFEYEKMIGVNRYSEMEQGYVWLCWLFAQVSDNFSHFILIVSLFEFTAIGLWVWRNSKKPFLSLLIFVCMFYTFFLTGIRQCIALSILLFAYDFAQKRRIVIFSVLLLFAASFHQTALIFALTYFIPLVKRVDKAVLTSLITIPLLYLMRESIFVRIVPLFDRYSDYEILTHGAAITYTLLLALIVLVAIILLKLKPFRAQSEQSEYSCCLICVLISLHVMPFVGLNGSFMRVAMYFSLFVCLLIEKIYAQFKELDLRLVAETVSIIVLVALFFNELSGSSYIYEFVGWDRLL